MEAVLAAAAADTADIEGGANSAPQQRRGGCVVKKSRAATLFRADEVVLAKRFDFLTSTTSSAPFKVASQRFS